MIKVFGHVEVLDQLRAELPTCSLFRGPESVGKWTAAEHLAQHHGYIAADIFRSDPLTADDARTLKRFMMTSSFGKSGKLAVLNLDGASENALNGLLKLLEEPPRRSKFILVSSRKTLDTIASRSHVYQFGLLEASDVFSVLRERVGMNEDKAFRVSQFARGQVTQALDVDQLDASKAKVLGVLKALADSDVELFSAVTSRTGEQRWDRNSHELLRTWCTEAITGRWRVFTEAETFGLARDKRLPRAVLFSLRSEAIPHLSVRADLMPLLAARARRA